MKNQTLAKSFLSLLLITIVNLSNAQSYPFQNTELSEEERLDDIMERLTVEEKINQLLFRAPAIERLGIPKYNWWNESLHGVARAGYATVFPQSITIAASWDKDLIFAVASAISDEARAKHHEYIRRGQREIYQGLTFWSPNINIYRDPRWGRGHETYGEDPYLTGELGTQFVKGLQGDDQKYLKVVATAKHFAVHSGPEPLRHEFDVMPTQKDLWETYLPAFRSLVKEGNVYSVMTAYNRVYGEAASASDTLFDILRNKWGFDGYVVSDCGAIYDMWKTHGVAKDAMEASAMAVKEGCDLNCGNSYEKLTDAVKNGLINEAELTIALRRLMRARLKLGMFDPDEKVPYAQIPFSDNNSTEHNDLAKKAARESIVLLKNKNNLLPFSKEVKKVAVIGPNAANVQSLWGNYNGIPKSPVTVLQGIKNKLGSQTTILYEEGCELAKGIPSMEAIPSKYLSTKDGKQGLTAQYYNETEWKGVPLFTKIDSTIDFQWDIETPDPRLKIGNYSVRWTGYITPPKTGIYYFSDWGKPFMEFTIANEVKGGGNHEHRAVIDPKEMVMERGKKYKIEVKYNNYYGDATAKMLWSIPKENQLKKATEIAKDADVVILALGLNERLEGEEMKVAVEGFSGGDRTDLNLPKAQIELMQAIVATGKPVVLVLLNGSALSINWASANVPAILSAGYPGQEGGDAIADVLFGDYNPAGRLPVTYYKSVDDLPPFEDYNMQGRTYKYFNKEPLYPFGYGLSYTKFEYSSCKLPTEIEINKPIPVSVEVTNTGNYDGDEVVQLYLTDEEASTKRPIRQLIGFKRIHLKKGGKQKVEFTIQPRQLSMINNEDRLVIEPGWFTISVGGKQPGFTGGQDANTTQTILKRIEVKGKSIPVAY
ncbi:glycoside hydrolase family 3 C-terminal domain-containing protein [Galbibacter pacificus]|uniref:Glycoside hydrolase family 3 C-terminal domain-containing protein n=1 Tax=Galbibacter pacificus TaxID=2996052 RepID=A0ABT6FSM1_9FLAO|nr:glycoside hydrolase family 3 C-terminal domain-containing protein [Galbibacter pacificus]MDG3582780.1 glycoside hydrolase family 3 C-terminal domain-containing protein [Galbibacter pacificus]MDG3586101.1 glycoside hydrolase family 3 C-terminal domain-containing protein [Galbibacter pacificus]